MTENNLTKFYNLAAPILICGETGTGKSCLARKIYDCSSLNKEKFITLHLASIKEELFESELFGHRKGSFTGAVENKNGYLKEVGNGTLFLDEIGELSLESQKKLLYVLEEKKYVPVGGVNPIEFTGRIIFATNRDLVQMVKCNMFREDLYYRLMVFQITLIPLRKNREVLKIKIIENFNLYKKIYKKSEYYLSNELQNYLENYEWRGNHRELKNCMESLVALSESREINCTSLPTWLNQEAQETNNLSVSFASNYKEAMEKFEELYLRHMFEKYNGRVNETARQIKISKVNLIHKSKKYHINTLKIRVNALDGYEKLAA